ncbi:MAG: peptidoglycan-binding protein, partial [Gammaproteobacteria bacterium HGW-Gammaproteobacteria-1]
MYSDYFGIRENAFSITPDPRYLYMSERHREAFAHLLYGAVESGGFVQLTGEVGTGKTTVCRAFLDQLPEQVDVALLLNPPETPRELLLGIITELRIPLRTPEAPLKVLVDRLNAALLAGHAKGRRTVVIIDEAQNIRPEVLEQVRLLTNLETRTAKLLQLFLIGQPELREQLTRPSLRQVAQRITARYHLEPLSRAETEDYIRHRLTVAGCREGLFTTGAMKQVYQESEGIPRVINILCDRALLGAFAVDKAQVDGPMVRYAARQWRGAQRPRDGRRGLWRGAGIAAALLLLATALVYTYRDEYLDLPLLRTLLTPALAAPVHAPAAPAVAEPAAP